MKKVLMVFALASTALTSFTFVAPKNVSEAMAVTPTYGTVVSSSKEGLLNLQTATILDIQKLLESGKLTSVELTQMYVNRIKLMNSTGPSLNAVRSLNQNWFKEALAADQARKAGKDTGHMQGIPVLLKDNIDVKGMPTTGGSLALVNSYPAEDAPLVKSLREAGAIILGKVNMHELAGWVTFSSPESYSSLGGMVRNPYDASLPPGSSSSGSGVAAAVAMSSITVGTDTGGSIMNPTAIESLAGIRPTVGLISRTGVIPISSSQDTPGPMGRNVTDIAIALTAMTTGVDELDNKTLNSGPYDSTDYTQYLSVNALKGVRIGVPLVSLTGDKKILWDAALSKLEEQGASLVSIPLDMSNTGVGDMFIYTYEFKEGMQLYLNRLPAEAPIKTVNELAQYYRDHPDTMLKFGADNLFNSEKVDLVKDHARSIKIRQKELANSKDVIDRLAKIYEVDTFVFPDGSSVAMSQKSGYPAVGVPAGYQASNRNPFGISFLGNAAYTEGQLLGYAYAYEQATKLRQSPEETNPSLFMCIVAEKPAYCAP
ncbi:MULTISPECIES: amidase family protein [unclassified Paenibacillus]|uniref:amidase family protein n=1 Tax=unclassified Paenibacillus TaxID=185978 RepID=UPI002406B17D|nr:MULTISPECIES: amidase family protein [unclassified Paenibacillus]MDF9843173.1 amidase [Paenibacillus sp. PastF-2]MDF9849615.1 amidase [Paenibacillus sp. PastM-2]MDF9856468.1 amidase [Paenibacillus sp. PastF-1]MDH6481739.1 amidase [Paenibacillus sp. PastH-2]MDH6509020.1 amidase [Paenibacillus sp. PastM-3]